MAISRGVDICEVPVKKQVNEQQLSISATNDRKKMETARSCTIISTARYLVCPSRFELPGLTKEVGVNDFTWPKAVGWRVDIDHRPIGKLGNLPSVVEIRKLAIRKTTIENYVSLLV
jgi:hypothetical protein